MQEIRSDQEVVVISREIEPIQAKVADLVIVDERTSKIGSDLKEFVKRAWKKLEERRKFFVGPLNDHIKTINNEFKSIMLPLEEMEESLKAKLMSYMQVEREKQRKEAEEKQAALDKMAEANNLPKVEVKVEEKRTVTSSLGKSWTRKTWAWRISDEKKIPAEYWIIDEKKIGNMVKAFTRTIDGKSTNNLHIEGIEVYQEESVV